MTTFLKTIFDTAKDRLKNPLLGSFIFLWAIFNWRPLLIIFFSNENVEDRIKLINTEYTATFYFIPIGIAIVYVVILPFISWLIQWIIDFSIEGRKELRNKREISDLKREIKVTKERTELEKAIADNASQLELNSRITELNIEVQNKKMQLKDIRDKFRKMIPTPSIERDLSQDDRDLWDNLYLLFKGYKDYENFINLSKIALHPSDILFITSDFSNYLLEEEIIIAKLDISPIQYSLTDKGVYFWNKYTDEIFDIR